MNDELITLRQVDFLRRVQGAQPDPYFCKGADLQHAKQMVTIGFCERGRLDPKRYVVLTERAHKFLAALDRARTQVQRP